MLRRPESIPTTHWRIVVAIAAIAFLLSLYIGVAAQTKTDAGTSGEDLHRAPKDGGARRWQAVPGGTLRLHDAPSASAKVIGAVPAGAVLASFGCAAQAGDVWCEVRPFRGGARGFARAAGLLPAEGPDGIVPMGVDNSKRRARKRDFDASGTVPCAQEKGEDLGTCALAVARGIGGDATAVVTFPNGFARQLYFVHGEFVSASSTMSGTGVDTDWRLENGLHLIRVDDQRYELPDALVFGDR